MMQTYRIDLRVTDEGEPALAAAVDALNAGGLVILPTDTVFGVAARPDLATATDRLFTAKRRPAELNLPVLAATRSEALTLTDPPGPAAERLAQAFWPGPLTLILPRSVRSARWHLGDRAETIGVRVPGHPIALALLRRTGPLAVTSANRSGEPPLKTAEDLGEAFGDHVAVLLLDRAGESSGVASTIVDLTRTMPSVVRRGSLDVERVMRVAGGEGRPSGGSGAR
jgi:tRNA threonylcarbamoyl adenosine modification protein (Sua5/YciO/YrdC/YwlC family)